MLLVCIYRIIRLLRVALPDKGRLGIEGIPWSIRMKRRARQGSSLESFICRLLFHVEDYSIRPLRFATLLQKFPNGLLVRLPFLTTFQQFLTQFGGRPT